MTTYSLLDLAPITQGSTPGEALRNSLDLARQAEKWGYERFWVAEHHIGNRGKPAREAPERLVSDHDREVVVRIWEMVFGFHWGVWITRPLSHKARFARSG